MKKKEKKTYPTASGNHTICQRKNLQEWWGEEAGGTTRWAESRQKKNLTK